MLADVGVAPGLPGAFNEADFPVPKHRKREPGGIPTPNGVDLAHLGQAGSSNGSYELRVQLIDTAGRVAAERGTELIVSPRNHIPRPGFIYRRGFPAGKPGLLAMKRGEELWNLGEIDAAISELTRAVEAKNPDLPEASWKLAAVYLSTGRAEQALPLLEPMEKRFPDQFEVVGGLGYAYYFQENYPRARELLERAATLRPPDKALLNALGDSYRQLGDLDSAVEAYRRSLAIDPEQEDVKSVLESISPGLREPELDR